MKVIIYSTKWCQYCKIAKTFFDKHKIPYEERNVAEDEHARDEMEKKSHQLGVPVIEIGEHIFVGFNRSAIEEVLNIK